MAYYSLSKEFSLQIDNGTDIVLIRAYRGQHWKG